MEKELFALLRLGLENTTIEEENLSDFILLSKEQWARIGDMARVQGVLGVLLDGVDRLEVSSYGATRDLPVSQKLEWIGEVLTIEQANLHQMTVMNELAGEWAAFYGFCERNHLRRFADAMTTIAVRYLNVNHNDNMIIADSPYAEKILHNALYEDDYVFSSGESSWKNRRHIVKNLFKYRWKYEEIYQQSVWKQLWWYASGFVFKTE